MMKFDSIKDLKRQPVERKVKALQFPSGFPVPMGKQMSQSGIKKKLKFPSPKRVK